MGLNQIKKIEKDLLEFVPDKSSRLCKVIEEQQSEIPKDPIEEVWIPKENGLF